MTDAKKPGPIDDIDWDEALAEWEGKGLAPEVAAEIPPDGIPPERPASRRLYRPPSVPPPPRTVQPRVPRPAPPPIRREGARIERPTPRSSTSHPEPVPSREPAPKRAGRHGIDDAPMAGPSPDAPLAPFPPPRGEELTLPASEEILEASLPDVIESIPVDSIDEPSDTDAEAKTPLPPMRGWEDEKPASLWLDEAARAEFEDRAAWLEQEARARADKTARARGLLVAGELLAMLGRREPAYSVTAEARDLVPSSALSHRQARALLSWPPDPDDHLEALDAEARAGPPGPPRIHSMLLAVDSLRMTGNDRGASARIDDALRAAPGDARVAVALAIRALSASTAGSASRLPGDPQVATIAHAAASCLQLRGNDVKVAPVASVSSNVLILRTRQALDRGDVEGAIANIVELARLPELASAALWLASALGAMISGRRRDAARWLGELIQRGEVRAIRPLLARAIELDDSTLLAKCLDGAGPMTSAERVILGALGNRPYPADDPHVAAAAATPGMQPLIFAIDTMAATWSPEQFQRGATGSPMARLEMLLGKALGASIPSETLGPLLGDDRPPAASGVALEHAVRCGRFNDVSQIVQAWGTSRGSDRERAAGAYTAALVALRGRQPARALEAFKAARSADPSSEATLRGLASLEPTDLALELKALADELQEGLRATLARIEAVERARRSGSDVALMEMLERAHEAAPSFPIAAFLAGRLALNEGDLAQTLAWTRRRRLVTTDAVEGSLETIREALLIASQEPKVAAECLFEAHVARPTDVSLRELYERLAEDAAASGRAAWLEQRLAHLTGDARAVVALEAAREFEAAGDKEGALRCAFAAGDASSLGRIAHERAEIGAGQFARLTDQLLTFVRERQGDATAQREAHERLAVLDATVRQDAGSALLWHRAILEEHPAHLPSLRYVEHYLIGEGRDDELEPVATSIARSLRGTGAGECTAHAELAAHLQTRIAATSNAGFSREMLEIGFSEGEPSLWALRAMAAQASSDGDYGMQLSAWKSLAARAYRPSDAAILLYRAADAALHYEDVDEARALLEQAAVRDPGDVRTWSSLAELRMRIGDANGAAEAFEAMARSSGVALRQRSAWYEAGRLWDDIVGDAPRAIAALEAVGALDVEHTDVFERLASLYAGRQMHAELADLLERQITRTTDPSQRIELEVRRGRALLTLGDLVRARAAFEGALQIRPDHADALSSFADLSIHQRDWEAAEQALVRLARLLPSQDEQRGVYLRLSDLYSHHLLNLSRAEVALKEVLKRAPDDVDTAHRLIDIYKRQNDPTPAIEIQQELVARATSPEQRRARLLELAALQEHGARDPRRAERTLEAARREFPQDLGLLRELTEFYQRHQQAPAVKILLDRVAGDARRALAAGQISPIVFETLGTVFELRGRKDGARVAQGMIEALEARPFDLRGGGDRALDPQVDDWLAPESLSPALRALLAKAGDALDAAAGLNLRELRATPAKPNSAMAHFAARVAAGIGISGLQVFTSPKIALACLPVSSTPPSILLGEALADQERIGPFLVVRALKLVKARASALARLPGPELSVLVAAWLKCFNPPWRPKWAAAAALDAAYGKVRAALPRHLEPSLAVLGLEAGAAMEEASLPLGSFAIEWADRASLLALGDPSLAFEAIAATIGDTWNGATDRSGWIARTPEALSLAAFAVSDAFVQARARLGLDA
jgi:predicted Zn-dependent protease